MADRNPGALRLRVISALVIAPLALAAVWFGWPWLPLMTLMASGAMGWEWARLCGVGGRSGIGVAIIATAVASVLVASAGCAGVASAVAAAGSAGILIAALAQKVPTAPWAAVGTFWIALPCVAFVWLGGQVGQGRNALLWLLAIVWVSDIAAFAVGRAVGGPRLAPRLSPNKTWSGSAGGLVGAALVGVAVAWLSGGPPLLLIAVSLLLGLAAQIGDLAESLAKRHFHVKDSSGLIPGHGGVLDRLDSALTAVAAQALVILISGASPLVWRS